MPFWLMELNFVVTQQIDQWNADSWMRGSAISIMLKAMWSIIVIIVQLENNKWTKEDVINKK